MRKYPYSTLLLVILLAIVVLTTIVIRFAEPINDGDIWFHLAYGRYFLENHTLIPNHSIFSWTPAENNTIYCAWISEIIFYLLFNAGGLHTLYALRYLFIIIFILLVFPFSMKNQVVFIPIAFLICLIGLLMSYAGLRIKPELFSFILMTIMVWAWFKIKIQPDKYWPLFYLLPIIMLTWVNSHGGFIFGIIFLILVLLGEVLNWIIGTSEKLDPRFRRHLFISTILSSFALFITPYGWQYPAQLINNLIIHPEEFISHRVILLELQSIFYPHTSYFHFIDYLIVSSIILIILLIAQMRRHRTDWTLLLVNASFLILYIKYLRATYFWAVIFVFSSIYLIKKVSQDDSELLIKKSVKFVTYSIAFLLLAFFSVRAQYETFCNPIGLNVDYISPEPEAIYIRSNFQNLLMGNDYISGSYLLWSLWPMKKVFIDSRYFPYRKWCDEEYDFEWSKNKEYNDSFIKKYNPDLWCVSHNIPALQYFIASPDWRLVYYGPSACIFLSKRVPFSQHEHSIADAVYKVGIYKANTITMFALSVGDFEVAKNIVKTMTPIPISPQQIKLAMNAKLKVGNELDLQGKYYDAIDVYTNALTIDQKNIFSFYFLDNEIKTEKAMLYNNLGCSLMKVNQIGEAVKRYTEAMKIKPDLTGVQENFAFAMAQMTKIDKSISNIQGELAYQPNNPKILHSLAIYHSMKGEYDAALAYLIKEMNMSPNNPGVYYNIACMYSRQNKLEETITYLNKAIKMGFNDWDLLRKDHDLDNIRNTQYFYKLMENQ